MIKEVKNALEMIEFGQKVGEHIFVGCVIELVGDVGAGKTTFVKGLAVGLGIKDSVQSPSFTINREYSARDGLLLSHYDFYRLNEAGVLSEEFQESINDTKCVSVVEWSDVVKNTLPQDRLTINILLVDDNIRRLDINSGGIISDDILNRLKI